MPDFSRRTLLGIAPAIAILSVPRDRLVLEAIAAERMPHQLLVSGVARSDFFELRNYGAPDERLIAVLNRHGIWPALEENGRFLFPFESLAARERAWREVSADAEWIALAPHLTEIAIYRAISLERARTKKTLVRFCDHHAMLDWLSGNDAFSAAVEFVD